MERERRSWPWKKKSSAKHALGAGNVTASAAASANVSPANNSSRHHDEYGAVSKLLADQVQEATARYQQVEERNKALNDRLSSALSDITEKDNLVKQHTKVAEEAVTGWEKAETEAANLKQQLDAALKQKTGLEGRVTHLDGALKECVRQLRQAKEDHDQKMHDLVAKKNSECEKLRTEFEKRLADVGHRLLESSAEVKVLSATLQDRMRDIAEISDAKSKAESDISVLNVRLESSEKDNMALRYEIQVLNKEVQIRTDEKDYSKREAEAMHRQQQESLIKNAKLEAECQRLRALVRRKLPGPAAVAQMRQEVDSWGREERRRSLGSNSSRGSSYVDHHNSNRLSGGSKDFQIQLLTERLLSMEEETKMLREVLSQRNSELQTARVATASRLSETASISGMSRTKFEMDSSKFPSSRSVSECSINDEATSCADAWASHLISELDQFKKETPPEENAKLEMMDDFAEMEQLASEPDACKQQEKEKDSNKDDLIAEKEREINAANKLCVEISSKLVSTEKELAALKIKNAANETAMVKLQEKLDYIFESQAEQKTDDVSKNILVSANDALLTTTVHKVIYLIETLAQGISGSEQDDNSSLFSPSTTNSSEAESEQQNWQSVSLNTSIEKLTIASNQLLEGNLDLNKFMTELSEVLSIITHSISSGDEHGCKRIPALIKREISAKVSSDDTLQIQHGSVQHDFSEEGEEVHRLRIENKELQEKIEQMKAQLKNAEDTLAELHSKEQSLRNESGTLSSMNAELEARIKETESRATELSEKLQSVEALLEKGRSDYRDLEDRFQQLGKQSQDKRQQTTKSSNEEDLGAKLAECQRTILALGKQLKTISSTRDTAVPDAVSRVDSSKQSSEQAPSYGEEGMSDSEVGSNRLQNNEHHSHQHHHRQEEPWSPPRSNQRRRDLYPELGNVIDVQDSSGSFKTSKMLLMYSPDHPHSYHHASSSPFNNLAMKLSPARLKKKESDLSKSVNIPPTFSPSSNKHSNSFTRLFSRTNK